MAECIFALPGIWICCGPVLWSVALPAVEKKERRENAMTNRYVIRIHLDGESELVCCNKKGTLTLKTLQRLVSGPIETVPTVLSDGWAQEDDTKIIMVVNEEGRLLRLPHNEAASLMAAFGIDCIVGPAVIMAGRGDELIGLLPGAAKRIKAEWLGEGVKE